MKIETVKNRIAKKDIICKNGKIKTNYRLIIEYALAPLAKNKSCSLHSWRKSCGRWSLVEYRDNNALRDLLGLMGVKYTEGNESPRGGADGDYLAITAAEDVAAEDTPAASSAADAAPASGDHAPGGLSTFAATPGAPSIIPAF